jgi:hypothetical protein
MSLYPLLIGSWGGSHLREVVAEMAYTDIHAAATDATSTLRKKVVVAIYKAALDVRNEAASTPNHAARLAWAMKVAGEPGEPERQAAAHIWGVMENATIAANPATATDADVQFAINALVDRMAEAYRPVPPPEPTPPAPEPEKRCFTIITPGGEPCRLTVEPGLK